jgi:hypothetical protein
MMESKKMAKEAKIKCPHCGKSVTVRQLDKGMADALLDDISKALDGVSKAVNEAFKKIFK